MRCFKKDGGVLMTAEEAFMLAAEKRDEGHEVRVHEAAVNPPTPKRFMGGETRPPPGPGDGLVSFTHEDLTMIDNLTSSLRKAAKKDARRNLHTHAYQRREAAKDWEDLRGRIAEHVPVEDEANGHGSLEVM